MAEFILPKDIPLDRYPAKEVFLEEGKRIIEAARQKGIYLRVMGPLALHYYFPDRIELYARLERLGERYFTDIDYAAYGKTRKHLMDFFKTMGYECDLATMAMTGKTRHIYFGGKVPMIDVFIDELDYCHKVSFEGRLDKDPWSIPLADILLQKLQIWEINDKDYKDIEFLFIVSGFGDDDERKINQSYIARRLSDDWGFWYTATTNLDRLKRHVDTVAALTDEEKARVKRMADHLRARIDAEPKTKGWEKRARKGTRKIWYNEGFSDW